MGVLPEDNEVIINDDTPLPDVEIETIDDTPEADQGRAKVEDLVEETEDPTEDELKTYSERVQKRIKDLNLRAHAERRSREERDRQLNEATAAIQKLRSERDLLATRLHEGEQTLIREHVTRVDSEMARARDALIRANEEGDATKQGEAYEKLAQLAALKQQALSYRPQFQPQQVQQQPQQAQPQLSEKARDWAKKNPWFQVDPDMTRMAFNVHNRMVAVDGIAPDTDVYYQRLDAEMRRRFPEKFGMGTSRTEAPRQTASAVAPAERTTATGPRNKIRLTVSQQALAKKLRITPEQYAREVLKLGGNNG